MILDENTKVGIRFVIELAVQMYDMYLLKDNIGVTVTPLEQVILSIGKLEGDTLTNIKPIAWISFESGLPSNLEEIVDMLVQRGQIDFKRLAVIHVGARCESPDCKICTVLPKLRDNY